MGNYLKARIYWARRRFAAIATCYFLGAFNDNFYKQAALFVAVSQRNSLMQALATGLLTMCYMLAAAPSGWMADRYSKGQVIIAAKAVELAAMLVGAWGVWADNWGLVLAMTGVMGAQSAIFSPAMNGSIPELYPPSHVQTANAVVRILTTTAIFLGMALAGWMMPQGVPSTVVHADAQALHEAAAVSAPAAALGQVVAEESPVYSFAMIPAVGWVALAVAAIGFAVSFGAPRLPAAAKKRPRFPWAGPWDSILEFWRLRHDRVLELCVHGNVFLWSIAALIVLLLDNLGMHQFGLSPMAISVSKIIFLLGVAGGGALSNVVAKGKRFFRIFVPTLFAMGVALLVLPAVPWLFPGEFAVWMVFAIIGLFGIGGGILMIPLETFTQIRPEPHRKGRVIAAANFGVFFGITIAAAALYLLNIYFEPLTSLGLIGGATMAFAVWMAIRLGRLSDSDLEEAKANCEKTARHV